jgi:segregation and condensation protein A
MSEPEVDPRAPSAPPAGEVSPGSSETVGEVAGVEHARTPVEPDAENGAPPVTAPAGESESFVVDLPAFQGPLEQLVQLAHRGEIDLAEIPVSEITTRFRRQLGGGDHLPDPRQVADFLTLAARLLALKAQRLIPDSPLDTDREAADEDIPVDDPGARLAEYRLFKAAAEALLAPVAEEGIRSFLGLISAEIVPSERLQIPPERLATAFRSVLERLPQAEPFAFETATFSVEEKVDALRELLRNEKEVAFEAVFAAVTSRLEAVACFLALLELVRLGEARVGQSGPFAGIMVKAVG